MRWYGFYGRNTTNGILYPVRYGMNMMHLAEFQRLIRRSMKEAFFPGAVYAVGGASPRVMMAPPKYIQGAGVLDHIFHYLSLLDRQRFGILASSRGHRAEGGRVAESIQQSGGTSISAVFEGECSVAQVDKHSADLVDARIDCLIAVGGGKCVDAGKCIAYRVGVPVVIVPTLASNDAPCSALSVMYSDAGVMDGAEFFPDNPVLVVVDTSVVAAASARYLVAGMGDAMATWYEARVCAANPHARTVLGARPTLAAGVLGELCADILYRHGEQARQDVSSGVVSSALDDVVEANTLLSGIGFESGGLAGAHGYAQGFTNLRQVEANFLHGEMVAMGVVAQLMMEGDDAEARRVAAFFARVGLPVTLEQIGVARNKDKELEVVAAGAMGFLGFENLPFPVTQEKVTSGLLAGDALGQTVIAELGDDAYRALQA